MVVRVLWHPLGFILHSIIPYLSQTISGGHEGVAYKC